jgi:hypothetical protein
MAQSDIFLQIDGVDGESQDDKKRNQIEIVSFAIGGLNAGSVSQGGKAKVNLSEMRLIKHIDKSVRQSLQRPDLQSDDHRSQGRRRSGGLRENRTQGVRDLVVQSRGETRQHAFGKLLAHLRPNPVHLLDAGQQRLAWPGHHEVLQPHDECLVVSEFLSEEFSLS